MTVLEALAILEAATLQCKERDINTPAVRDALDLLEPHTQPEWLIPQFRFDVLDGYAGNDADGEAQQQAKASSLSLKNRSIIDPFLCLLKEAIFSFGFRCESINGSGHDESPNLSTFGIFNSSFCTPVKSSRTSL
jgi:hypothetical protein